ncbi:hypothetical protein N0V88_000799 [Collariella sp. IMI 366227]|nr:hypothetical protein N0V88_000799 [Collariella sp. IMI 366227]
MSAPGPPAGVIAEKNKKKLLVGEEFGSVLDESLVILIAEERDLAADFEGIRETLAQLAETASAEAATGFDPSGLSSLSDLEALRLDDATSGNGLDSSVDFTTTISDFSDQSDSQRLTYQTDLSDDQKVQELKLIFKERWKDHTLLYVLKQNAGSLDRAFDDLLSREFLEENGSLPKGIDGFFTPEDEYQPSKGKGGRAQKDKGKNKKQLIAVKYNAVSSTVDDGELEGAKDFVKPSSSRSNNSCTSLAFCPNIIRNLPGYRPTRFWRFQPARSRRPPEDGPTRTPRRPLGRQGAVVYTERAKYERLGLAAHASREAEELVARQSSADMVDLHGVFVMDGVRIAKGRVWAWWNGLGENKKVLAKQKGFTVVTGVGRHSAGGVSRLRQAVGAFLRNDGWRVEILTGKFYVTGRANV